MPGLLLIRAQASTASTELIRTALARLRAELDGFWTKTLANYKLDRAVGTTAMRRKAARDTNHGIRSHQQTTVFPKVARCVTQVLPRHDRPLVTIAISTK